MSEIADDDLTDDEKTAAMTGVKWAVEKVAKMADDCSGELSAAGRHDASIAFRVFADGLRTLKDRLTP